MADSFTITIGGVERRLMAFSAAEAVWRVVEALPEQPASGTRVLVQREGPDGHAWLLRVVVNRTKAGREYIQFRDPEAERRERAFRAWWRARHGEGVA